MNTSCKKNCFSAFHVFVLLLFFSLFVRVPSFAQDTSETNEPGNIGSTQIETPSVGTETSPEEQPPAGGEQSQEQESTENTDSATTAGTESSSDENSGTESPEVELRVGYDEMHFFTGGVSAISVHPASNKVFFAGNDGFVTALLYPSMSADTWQVSRYRIKALATHPVLPYIAFYETDDMGVHMVSVWDWNKKEAIYQNKLDEQVVSISWSARGSYLFVGNTSISGVNVFDAQGNEVPIFVVQPGIVLLAATTENERSVMTYSEAGNLVYTNLNEISLPTTFDSEKKLINPVVLNDYRSFAGYKNGTIFMLDALSGKNIQTYKTNEPVFATRITDTVPLWLEKAGAASYCIRQGNKASPDFAFNETITVAAHLGGVIFAGTREGSIYVLQQESNLKVSVRNIRVPAFTPIIALQGFGKNLYALTDTAIYYKDEYSDDFVLLKNFFSENTSPNRMTVCDTGIFLWKFGSKEPVYFYSFETDKIKPFFKSSEPVLDVTAYRSNCLLTLKFSGLKLFDHNAKLVFEYKIGGIQSAKQINEKNVLMVKNSDDERQPIYLINIKSNETLPFPISGVFSYCLKENLANTTELYCFVISSDDGMPQTTLYKIMVNAVKPLESRFKKLLNYSGEALDSFIQSRGDFTVTNLGGSLVAVDSQKAQVLSLSRSYAFSGGGTFTDAFFYALNADGTLGVYDRDLHFIGVLKLHQ